MKILFNKKNKISEDKQLKEASEWVMDINSESMTPEKQADLMNWLYEDYENRTKRDLVDSVWESLDELKDHPLTAEVLENSRAREQKKAKQKWFPDMYLLFPQIKFAAMAAMVLLVIGGLWVVQTNMPRHKTYATQIGEQKTAYLADGSIVYLDTKTVVVTSYTKGFRNVDLEEGKAMFTVAHDSSRPFIVTSGGIAIRALGTEFSIYKREKGDIVIAVTKGRIQVSREKESKDKSALSKPDKIIAYNNATPQYLSERVIVSGQEIIVDEKKAMYTIKQVDIQSITAWQEGRLDFQNTPLSDVIGELNRYVENEIVIGDDRLKDIRINIYFKIKNQKDFISTLKLVIPIRVITNLKGQKILLSKDRFSAML